MSKTVKRAKSAQTKKAASKKASPKAVKTAKKTATKKVDLPKLVVDPKGDKNILERGGEFLALLKRYSQSEIITAYQNAGLKLSSPAFYNAVKIARAPKEVLEAVRSGKVPPTLILPFLKRRFSDEQIVEKVNVLMGERDKHSKFLQKSGFNEGSKLTLGRTVDVIRKKLEKLQKSNALTQNGHVALALTKALANVHDAEAIDALAAEFAGKAKK